MPSAQGGSFACSMFGELDFSSRFAQNPPDSRIDEMVSSIVEVTGLRKNFALYASDVPNAAATIYQRKPRGAPCACYVLGQPWAQGVSWS